MQCVCVCVCVHLSVYLSVFLCLSVLSLEHLPPSCGWLLLQLSIFNCQLWMFQFDSCGQHWMQIVQAPVCWSCQFSHHSHHITHKLAVSLPLCGVHQTCFSDFCGFPTVTPPFLENASAFMGWPVTCSDFVIGVEWTWHVFDGLLQRGFAAIWPGKTTSKCVLCKTHEVHSQEWTS